jgi:hypothetical protein
MTDLIIVVLVVASCAIFVLGLLYELLHYVETGQRKRAAIMGAVLALILLALAWAVGYMDGGRP